MNKSQINIHDLIDYAKFTPFHWKVLILCLIIIIFDGYDLVIYGVALTANAAMVIIGSTSRLTGQCCIIWNDVWRHDFGTLSDKLGRKKTILICVSLFSGFTFYRRFCQWSCRICNITLYCRARYRGLCQML